MANHVCVLMSCIGRLTSERRLDVELEFARGRAEGLGDGESSLRALAILTDAERALYPLDNLVKPKRPPVCVT